MYFFACRMQKNLSNLYIYLTNSFCRHCYDRRSRAECRRAFSVSQNVFGKTIDSTIREKSISRSKFDNCPFQTRFPPCIAGLNSKMSIQL